MRRAFAALGAVLLAPTSLACVAEAGPSLDSARSTAADLASAWSEGNAETMLDLFDERAREVWNADELDRWLGSALRAGSIDEVQVSVLDSGGDLDETTGGATATVPYSVVYESRFARAPIRLEGQLPLTHDGERWTVAWREAHMWPGIEGARGFRVRTAEGRRGSIVDREGRLLAGGPADRRRYPAGAAAGSTVGHLGPGPRGPAGGSGMEEAFDALLAGRPGGTLEVVDYLDRRLESLGRRPPSRGRRVRSTLDLDVQHAAAAAFAGTTGGAVVLDPRTGDILAVVSSSEFNPANYVGVPLEPFNRALSGLYPPGSSLKVVTAAAALETGVVKPSSRLTGPAQYRGVRNFESGEFGSLDFATALKYSVNTSFAQVARRLGAARLTRFAEAFGFNRPARTRLAVATSSFPRPQDEGDLMWGAIGQAQVVATPLHMASVAATIANRGVRMEPRISFVESFPPRRVVSAATARRLTEMMEDVVVGGTGIGARVAGLDVAGKTGTAEVDVDGERENHAWFVCFAPAGDPRVAVAVVSELGGVGGEVAAPLARQILLAVMPHVE